MCGVARDPLWLPHALRAEEEHEARRTAHFALISILIAGLIALFITLRPNNVTPSAETRACHNADVLYLTELSQTGPLGAFSGKYGTEIQLTREITGAADEVGDSDVRTAIQEIGANLTGGKLAALPQLSALLGTCRSKGFLKGG